MKSLTMPLVGLLLAGMVWLLPGFLAGGEPGFAISYTRLLQAHLGGDDGEAARLRQQARERIERLATREEIRAALLKTLADPMQSDAWSAALSLSSAYNVPGIDLLDWARKHIDGLTSSGNQGALTETLLIFSAHGETRDAVLLQEIADVLSDGKEWQKGQLRYAASEIFKKMELRNNSGSTSLKDKRLPLLRRKEEDPLSVSPRHFSRLQ